jgi:hypothetical protein
MDAATDTHHCRGTKIIPFSLHNVDEVLDDLGLNISAHVRAWHWLNPVDPAAYSGVTPALLARLAARESVPPAGTPSSSSPGPPAAGPSGGDPLHDRPDPPRRARSR